MNNNNNFKFEIQKCQICGSNNWLELPDPNPYCSVTTASRIIDVPLGKSQCAKCGFVQKVRTPFLGLTEYYEKDYANYYERSGTEKFHKARYKVIIEWMMSYIKSEHKIKTILDVGCGQGWAMEILKKIYPYAEIEGLEPSKYNTKKAEQKGFKIYKGKLEDLKLDKKFDLVFSNNVIQHVNNAKEFISNLKKIINENGVLINTCPDGSKPNVELLWSDQNYSFLPDHLKQIAHNSGLKFYQWAFSPSSPSLPPAQLLLLSNNSIYSELNSEINLMDTNTVFKLRKEYLSSFKLINEYLVNKVSSYKKVYNFGASYWTSILAAYCPNYWQKVNACLIEEKDTTEVFLNKKILNFDEVISSDENILVFGTSPAWQNQLKEKLSDKYKNIITWNHLMKY